MASETVESVYLGLLAPVYMALTGLSDISSQTCLKLFLSDSPWDSEVSRSRLARCCRIARTSALLPVLWTNKTSAMYTTVKIELTYDCQCSLNEKRSGLISHLLEATQSALSYNDKFQLVKLSNKGDDSSLD
jgi:hypothetical protein